MKNMNVMTFYYFYIMEIHTNKGVNSKSFILTISQEFKFFYPEMKLHLLTGIM